jgi:hypothetical protein
MSVCLAVAAGSGHWYRMPIFCFFSAVGVLCADSPVYSLYHHCGLFGWKGLASAIIELTIYSFFF